MGTVDRLPYLTATTLDQDLLDEMASNLDTGLEMVAEIETPAVTSTYSNPSGNLVEVAAPNHPYRSGNVVTVTSATDAGLIGSWLVLAATPETFTFSKGSPVSPSSGSLGYQRSLYLSDRNKYVGDRYYAAGCQFPVIKRTMGEWLSPTIEFSRLELQVSNVSGALNHFLPGGPDFAGWIGKRVDVRVGLRDVSSTYDSIYRGIVTDVGGLQRDRSKITVVTRDDLDRLNQNFPKTALKVSSFPDLEDALQNTILPAIYGDWTVEPLQTIPDQTGAGSIVTASVPAYPVNGANASVQAGTTNLSLVVSDHALASFNANQVWVQRGENWANFPFADVASVSGSNNAFTLKLSGTGGTALLDGSPYDYKPGDKFFVRVIGKDLGAYTHNIIAQGKDILETYAGAVSGDFDATWATVRDKNNPSYPRTRIVQIKSRVWTNEPESAVTYVLSMFEQVRVEMFVSRELKLRLSTLHFEDFPAVPGHTVRQWDLKEGSLTPKLDDRNVWNRARAEYAYDPAAKAQIRESGTYRVDASIAALGKEISKKVTFPNLYDRTDVENQLQEMLRLAAAAPEFIDLTLTPRAFLRDLGEFVSLDLSMGGTDFAGSPAMIRDVGYDPKGIPVVARLWSFQMIPYPGYSPAYPTTATGGYNAPITLE